MWRPRLSISKKYLPKSLFGRTLLIVVTPTILALAVATFVFFNRHWYTMTRHLAYAVGGDIATIVELMQKAPTDEDRQIIIVMALEKMDISVSFEKDAVIKSWQGRSGSPLRALLKRALSDKQPYRFHVDLLSKPERVFIQIEAPEGVYSFVAPERRIYTPTTEVFIGWMIGSSILLSVLALLFMHKQIRPIRRLAAAADDIGKGRDVPWYKLEGAREVRQAGAALLVMNDRLRRQIEQRTTMLAGVSHDLRTPLTRMKLQLAMMQDNQDTQELSRDIADMQEMLEAYLAFARGDEAETSEKIEIKSFLEEIIAPINRHEQQAHLSLDKNVTATIRPKAMKRCVSNLIGNALRYGKRAEISVAARENSLDIIVDDNGQGIPLDMRETVFKPFLRLDPSRNPTTGGVGLGLTIARDIARSHGGDVYLEDSPMGGLRARIWLPV